MGGQETTFSESSKANVNEDRLIHIIHYNVEINHCERQVCTWCSLIEFAVPLDHDQRPF